MVKKKEGDGCDAMDGPERQAGCVDVPYMKEEREKRSWPRDRDRADVADTPGVSTVGTSRQRRLPPKKTIDGTSSAGQILNRCPLPTISLLLHLIET